MKSFSIILRAANGAPVYHADAYPLMATAGTDTVRLGVHRDRKGSWIISDPVSGGKLADVPAYYKGALVDSKDLSPAQAHRAAHAEMERLLALKGSARFEAALAKGKAIAEGYEFAAKAAAQGVAP